jgi:RNA polymerase sigma-70 factor (ECF subfamily)
VRFAMTLTRNQEDAEDALQTALLRISARPLLLAEAQYPWAYLLRVVRNEALNILRRRRDHADLSAAREPRVPASRELEQRDARLRVHQAVERLPRNQAEVVVLKIWEEMTFHEIAEVLGESPHTVASRYRYALQKLTRHLQPLAEEVLYP